MSEKFVLREFQFPNDYEAALALWRGMDKGIHIGPSDAPEEIQKKLERDADLFLVAEKDGVMIGTVIGGYDGRRGMIYHLAVAAGYRELGVGSALMNEVENRLRAKGCLKCYLIVLEGNDEAAAFYERRDWSEMKGNLLFGKVFG